jgi:hypothetical protein
MSEIDLDDSMSGRRVERGSIVVGTVRFVRKLPSEIFQIMLAQSSIAYQVRCPRVRIGNRVPQGTWMNLTKLALLGPRG